MPRYSRPRKTWQYSNEFEAKAVQLSHLDDVIVKDIADALDIHPFMLSRLRKEFREGKIVAEDTKLTDLDMEKKEMDRLRQLERENSRLKKESDLLKKWQRYLAEQHQNGSNLKARSREELADYVNRGNKVKYVFFWGHQKSKKWGFKSCFSQWYDSPYECDGHNFMTAEHHMMYQKAVLFGDKSAAERLVSASDPGEAKAIGREVLGFDQAKWDQHRFEIVISANMAKFSSNPELKEFLLKTGNRVLVEASPVDKIWGIGLTEDNPACENPNQWKGANLLGFALMEVRDQLS